VFRSRIFRASAYSIFPLYRISASLAGPPRSRQSTGQSGKEFAFLLFGLAQGFSPAN
jgi:hypothetical protein